MEVIEVAGKLLGLAVADLGTESASEDEDTCWSRDGSGASYEGGASEDEDGAGGKRKRMSADDRKARNRERNRLHARKTRQRKKQHVQELQLKIWGLRQERQRLLQISTEHRTAGVLLALSCSPKQCIQGAGSSSTGDSVAPSPRSPPSLKLPGPAGRDWSQELAAHEDALRKITQEFESMDGGQQVGDDACGAAACDEVAGGGGSGGVGQSCSGVGSSSSSSSSNAVKGSRGGGKGTLADRTALRRERNRMHAKRTRNRKKLFVEACSVMIDKMKVENAQLEHEIRESGIRLPQDGWADEGHETIPEEPLPEYLAALWDFAEGKTHCAKPPTPPPPQGTATTVASTTPPATPAPAPAAIGRTRETSFSSTSSYSSSSSSSSSTNGSTDIHPLSTTAHATPSRQQQQQQQQQELLDHRNNHQHPSPSQPAAGQALEDASTLCAFMEAAQTRSAKRPRVRSTHQERSGGDGGGGGSHHRHQPRGWSDHGSTTSESRGSSESDEEAANERKSADQMQSLLSAAGGGGAAIGGVSSGGDGGAMLSPAFWTSRQVLERYVLPRQQLLRG